MTLSNSDLAPALIISAWFAILSVLFYAYVAWYKIRRTRPAIQDKNAQIIADSVDGLFMPERSKANNNPDSRPPVIVMLLMHIGCVLVYFIVYIIVVSAVELVSPNPNQETKDLIDSIVALFLAAAAALIVLPLVRRWLLLSFPKYKLTIWKRWIWLVSFWAQYAAMFSVMIATIQFRENNTNFAILDLFVAISLLLPCIQPSVRSFVYFPFFWIQEPLLRAAHRETLRRIQIYDIKFPADVAVLSNRGIMQGFAGKYVESEMSLRQTLEAGLYDYRYSTPTLVQTLTYMGQSLLQQGRYQEATRAFQGALKLNPKAGLAVSGLAEIYLFQGTQSQSALDLVENFLRNVASRRFSDPYRMIRSALVGDKAWALALMGQQAKAEAAIEDAFRRVNKSFKPGLAGLHYRAGQVYKRNKRARAVKEFEQAVTLDPEGSWGQLARKALEELKVPVPLSPAQ